MLLTFSPNFLGFILDVVRHSENSCICNICFIYVIEYSIIDNVAKNKRYLSLLKTRLQN